MGQEAAVWTSPDLITWDRVPHDDDLFYGSERCCGMMMKDVAYGPAGYVAVGQDVAESGDRPAMWLSEDGRTWVPLALDESVFAGGWPESISYGPDGYVVVGSGATVERPDGTSYWSWQASAWFSADGTAWSRAEVEGDLTLGEGDCCVEMARVTYGAAGFVAIGWDDFGALANKAAVWLSVDGRSWSRVAHDPDVFGPLDVGEEDGWFEMHSVTWGSPGYVATGNVDWGRGQPKWAGVWFSPNGIDWSLNEQEEFRRDPIAVYPNDAAWGDGGYILIGREYELNVAAIWTSPDGLAWTRVPGDPDVFGCNCDLEDAYQAMFDAGRYYVFGVHSWTTPEPEPDVVEPILWYADISD
jgi:hypothetical protein